MDKENYSDKADWWETLTENQKASIDQGLKDVEEGKISPHSEVVKKYGISS